MAKAIKATKSKFLILNRLLAKLPEPKDAQSTLLLMGFFRNVKKALRKTLDEVSDLNKAKQKKTETQTKEYMELLPKAQRLEKQETRTAKDEAELADMLARMKEIDAEAAGKTKEETDRLKAIEDELNTEDITVNFDNENFNYIEDLFKKTPALFKVGEGKNERMDLDTMDDMLTLFDTAFNPDAKE